MLSNISAPVSYSKLKAHLQVKNTSTVTSYIDYFEQAWLFFVVNQFSPSIKKQQIAPKKLYSIDTGLVTSLAFSLAEQQGPVLENLIFLCLRKKYQELFYYKTDKGYEVDFSSAETRHREIRALLAAAEELQVDLLTIITFDHKEEIEIEGKLIEVIPAYEFLL